MTDAAALPRTDRTRVLGESFARVRGVVVPAISRAAAPARIITSFGWVLAAVGIVAAVAAAVWDWAEFVAIAVACGILILAAIPFVIGRARFDVRVELASPRVTVGDPAVGRVAVRNTASRPSRPARIELPVGTARAEFRLPRLAANAEHDELFTIPTQRRAVLTLGPVTSVRTDPVGLLRRAARWTAPTDLFVHPRIVSLTSDTTGFLRDLEGLPTRDLADDDVSFHALREYVPGDDRRYVHWRSTARTGKLMIRQFEQTRRSHLLIALSTRDADYRDTDEFELAVSIAGSIGVSALRDGKAVTVLTGAGRLAAASAFQLLDALSGVEISASEGLDGIARASAKTAPGASVVVFVTGGVTGLGEIRGAALRVPVTARSLCVRADSAGPLARRTIGDVATVSVPELSSLRSAMRAVTA